MAKKAAAKKQQVSAEPLAHILVPVHEKLSEKEKQELLQLYNVGIKDMPKILRKDPAISHLDAAAGDIIRITRVNERTGKEIYYRGVIDA